MTQDQLDRDLSIPELMRRYRIDAWAAFRLRAHMDLPFRADP